MSASIEYSDQHPHEPEIPPAFDEEGRCLVCGLIVKKDRAVYIAQHLWQMIPQEVWREHGAEWMGMYEGDYHAEKVREELIELEK